MHYFGLSIRFFKRVISAFAALPCHNFWGSKSLSKKCWSFRGRFRLLIRNSCGQRDFALQARQKKSTSNKRLVSIPRGCSNNNTWNAYLRAAVRHFLTLTLTARRISLTAKSSATNLTLPEPKKPNRDRHSPADPAIPVKSRKGNIFVQTATFRQGHRPSPTVKLLVFCRDVGSSASVCGHAQMIAHPHIS